MKKLIMFLLLWAVFSGLFLQSQHHPASGLNFRLSYLYQMDLKGRLLLMVPYRSYFEASASIVLTAKKNGQNLIFRLSSVDRTGYLLTTGGLTATSLYFFTADSSEERRKHFYHRKLKEFQRLFPREFSRFRKVRNRPMSVLSVAESDFCFERDPGGIHANISENILLSDSHSGTYSNIYGILGALVKSFNHSIFPADLDPPDIPSRGRVWKSAAVDYSGLLTETARLTSRYAEREIKPKQKHKIFLEYQVKQISDSRVCVLGRSESLIPFRKGMKLRLLEREIVMNRKDRELVLDEVRFVIGGRPLQKGKITVRLERLFR